MYQLHLSKKFTKDAKKLTAQDLAHTMEVLQKICNKQTLEEKYRDHALKGNLQGVRECHIKPDLILMYKFDGEILVIAIRIGKHSKVLK